jgi:phosphate:Na+ symporter
MSTTHIVINLLGEVALLLWGIHMVRSGVLRAYGSNLRHALSRGLKTRAHALMAGLGVTTLLQSSTATAMMATSFTADGAVGLVAALAMMLGANIGTTLITQALSFDITLVFPLLIFGGLVIFRRWSSGAAHDMGRVAIGLGLMLLSLHLLTETIEPVGASATALELLRALTRDPVLNLVLMALITWAAHSSVAAMLLILSLAAHGAIPLESGLAMVLGANLGSAINPLMAVARSAPAARRLPLGNLINRAVGCCLALPLLHFIQPGLLELSGDAARSIVNFHTGFNLVMALLFLPLLKPLAAWLTRTLPEQNASGDPGTPVYLDRSALATPAVALANASREALRMVDVVEEMLRGSHSVFHSDDKRLVSTICRMDDVLDRLNGEIHGYLAAINTENMGEEDTRRLAEIFSLTVNLEHIGDILDKNLMELAAKRIKHRLTLSADGLGQLDEMHAQLCEHLKLAVTVFMQGDLDMARRLVRGKEHFGEMERRAQRDHLRSVQKMEQESMETASIILDVVRDLKRIDTHIAAIAYPLLEENGNLKPSRLTG